MYTQKHDQGSDLLLLSFLIIIPGQELAFLLQMAPAIHYQDHILLGLLMYLRILQEALP